MPLPVKIHFHLEQDADGYPPVGVESLWAYAGEALGEYVIDNTPFFVRVATLGDTVHVREVNGVPWFDRLVRQSANSLVRVVFLDRDCVDSVQQHLLALGCSVEYLREYNLMAVNIPEEANLRQAQGYLQAEAAAGRVDFEEPILRRGHEIGDCNA